MSFFFLFFFLWSLAIMLYVIFIDHTLSIWLGTQFTQRYIHVADRK